MNWISLTSLLIPLLLQEERPFVFQPGADVPAIHFPRAEVLRYRTYLKLPLLRKEVGTVTQSITVETQRPSILLEGAAPAGETATVRLHAEGEYLWYTLESEITTRILPQEWPRILYQAKKEGHESRRREVLIGRREGTSTSSYRSDTDRNAPKGTRIWKEARLRQVPEGTLDMLSAVLMARTLIRENRDSLAFPLIDKDRLWQLRLRKGEERRIDTGAGTFETVEVVLEPGPYPGEEIAEKDKKKFEGLFGLHGTIHLWVDARTDITVRIQGEIPVRLMTLGLDLVLESYSGTPDEFGPLGSRPNPNPGQAGGGF